MLRNSRHSNRFKRMREAVRGLSNLPAAAAVIEARGQTPYQAMKLQTRRGPRIIIRVWPGSTRDMYKQLKRDHVSSTRYS